MKGDTTSATATLSPLKPSKVLDTTTFFPYLTPQTRPITNRKTTGLPTPGSQGLTLLTAPVTTTPLTQGQQNRTQLVAPPTNETVPSGVPRLPNAPLPAAPSQYALSELPVAMQAPEQDTSITTRQQTPNNMQLPGWTTELLMQIKGLELQLLNSQIKRIKSYLS